MGGERGVPADFVSFVETYGRRLAAACEEITGDDRLAEAMRLDLLATVALRWRRWWRPRRRRPRAALVQLDRQLRREVTTYRLLPTPAGAPVRMSPRPPVPASPPVALSGPPAAGAVLSGPPAAGPAAAAVTRPPTAEERVAAAALADAAWRRSRLLRRQAALSLVAAATILICLAAIGPRVRPPPAPEPPEPQIPAGVTVLPRFGDLNGLPQIRSPLPATMVLGGTSAEDLPSLTAAPVTRAVALARQDLGLLVVVGRDGALRRVDDPALAGARLVATSLSPDGDRAVLVMGDGLLVVDLHTGAVHSLPAGAVQPDPPTIVWRSAHSVVVPGSADAREVDLDTGAVTTLRGVTGADLVATEGSRSAPLTELAAITSTAGRSPRIRIWRTDPGAVPVAASDEVNASRSPGPAPGLSTVDPTAGANVEDRPVFGPIWIGAWLGPGWSSSTLLVRGCAATSLTLPPRYGAARAAVGAILPSGLYAGTLVAADTTQLDPLGFLSPQAVLVAARSVTVGTVILSWDPVARTVNRVSTATTDVRVSVADLLVPA